ncbi:TraX family protein [Variovorax robiniae]|uniref:TraX family protein n=1 Tax=Variovorax robiniae TaxID=1836199 RepID=A0ABU8XJ86_9BURK
MARVLHVHGRPAASGGRTAPLRVATGTLEALKWLGMVLMTLDHVNKYLLGGASHALFDLGRLVMPVFGFVLMYHLARPGAFAAGVHVRVMRRLLVFGALSAPTFIVLVGWWPLNILFMLLLSTGITWLIERGGRMHTTLAVISFVLAGAVVEFWWFGVLSCLGAWAYCRRPTIGRLALWTFSLVSLRLINGNFAALAALPLLLAASHIELPLARHRWVFYAFYPAHLAAIWLAMKVIA